MDEFVERTRETGSGAMLDDICIEFPHRTNPDSERALARELQWCDRYGLSADRVLTRKLLDAEPGQLALYGYPDAQDDYLDIAVDTMCFFFHLDNLFDEIYFTQLTGAAQLIDSLARCLDHIDRPDPTSPMCEAFSDIWDRCRVGKSWHWCCRAAAHWTSYLWANLAESTARHQGTVPSDIETYLSLRRQSIGVYPTLDLLEATGLFEVPPAVFYQPEMQRLRQLVCEHIVLCNDLSSLTKEESHGDLFNSVLVLERATTMPRHQAIDTARQMIAERGADLRRTASRISSLSADLDLSDDQCDALDRFVSGALAWVGVNAHAGGEARRYRAAR
jgi:pentalenene synthase